MVTDFMKLGSMVTMYFHCFYMITMKVQYKTIRNRIFQYYQNAHLVEIICPPKTHKTKNVTHLSCPRRRVSAVPGLTTGGSCCHYFPLGRSSWLSLLLSRLGSGRWGTGLGFLKETDRIWVRDRYDHKNIWSCVQPLALKPNMKRYADSARGRSPEKQSNVGEKYRR